MTRPVLRHHADQYTPRQNRQFLLCGSRRPKAGGDPIAPPPRQTSHIPRSCLAATDTAFLLPQGCGGGEFAGEVLVESIATEWLAERSFSFKSPAQQGVPRLGGAGWACC